MRIFAPLVVLLLTLVVSFAAPSRARASEITYRPLEEVVSRATLVFEADIKGVERTNMKTELKARYTLGNPKALRGTLPANATHASYVEIVPVLYDDKGNVTGQFSPTLDASGSELGAKSSRWLFFASPSPSPSPSPTLGANIVVFRLEPLASLPQVKTLLGTSATAPTPSAAPKPAPAPIGKASRGCGCTSAPSSRFAAFPAAAALVLALVRRHRTSRAQTATTG